MFRRLVLIGLSSIVVMFFMYSSNPAAITVGDLDGDGVLDLAVANNESNNVSVLLGY